MRVADPLTLSIGELSTHPFPKPHGHNALNDNITILSVAKKDMLPNTILHNVVD